MWIPVRSLFDGKDLTKIPMSEMYHIRGNQISVIFQEPMTALNPVFSVERQLSEPFIIHRHMSKKQAAEAAVKMLADVKIPNPEVVVKQYPHQLSGGMRQRVMIAMALACEPKLLIADEPTTALDVTIQAQILHLMNNLKEEHGTAIMFITHDLGVINQMADDVAVMYCGQVVEHVPARVLFEECEVLSSLYRRPDGVGSPPGYESRPAGCHSRRSAPSPGPAQGLQVCASVQILHQAVHGGGARAVEGRGKSGSSVLLSGEGGAPCKIKKSARFCSRFPI